MESVVVVPTKEKDHFQERGCKTGSSTYIVIGGVLMTHALVGPTCELDPRCVGKPGERLARVLDVLATGTSILS